MSLFALNSTHLQKITISTLFTPIAFLMIPSWVLRILFSPIFFGRFFIIKDDVRKGLSILLWTVFWRLFYLVILNIYIVVECIVRWILPRIHRNESILEFNIKVIEKNIILWHFKELPGFIGSLIVSTNCSFGHPREWMNLSVPHLWNLVVSSVCYLPI